MAYTRYILLYRDRLFSRMYHYELNLHEKEKKMKKEIKRSLTNFERAARLKKEQNSLDFAKAFLQTYLEKMIPTDDQIMLDYKEVIKEAIEDLESVSNYYGYLIGEIK